MSIKIALAGNPNCGKTTLFNALTGSNQYVGNWPGVTVEKKEGKLKKHSDVTITDLPGIYSLSPYTIEEIVARDYLINEKPDAVLNIIDGTNLERNLYLTTQVLELGIPVVVAVNMMDVVKKNGDKINIQELSRQLACPVFEISALKGTGIKEVANAAVEAASREPSEPQHKFSGVVEHALAHIEEATLHTMPKNQQRWYAIKIFEGDDKVLEQIKIDPATLEHIKNDIADAEKELDDDAESIITNERYIYIASIIKSVYTKKSKGKLSASDKIDKIVTNRILGLPIFAGVMALVYFISMKWIGAIGTDWVNEVLFAEWVPNLIQKALEGRIADWLYGLIQDGIVAGVGAVLGFVPQMIVLFLCLAFLEGCGYMSRVAFVMDRIFRNFGLSGKSFIPMLIGTGCGVPAVMASRTIENERDRRMTIMTTTFIPCSAKLPIIGLIAGACFGGSGWVATSAYFIGVASIIVSGIMLKKTKAFSGDPAPFVMELPAYHLPTVGSVLRSTWERAWSFIKKAGTVITLATILIWFLQAFTFKGGFQMTDDMDISILAYIGKAFCWLFVPLGWGGWKPAVASVTGLIAKENVVGTFGILYHFAGELAENGDEIWSNFAKNLNELSGNHASLAAYSFLIFNLLCAPCFAAIGAIKREMNNAKWTWFAIGYQCGFAYVIALIVYQFGIAFAGAPNVIGLIAAIVLTVGILYLLFRKNKYDDNRLTVKAK
ncbi:ferrous iron transport protein B [uncultured Eubacterium sp.]|uniref:ferrous iron transport protein B n=1 Tax=uncultured Eubacterium sp. TaxID=165185 RepID=UPI00262FCCDE|nr:ferrous iron transport protein B [uncultured Eubacterium sp.]